MVLPLVGRADVHAPLPAQDAPGRVGKRLASPSLWGVAVASPELRNKRRSIEEARAAGQAADPTIAESWRRFGAVVDHDRSAAPVDFEHDAVAARWDAAPLSPSGVEIEEQLTRDRKGRGWGGGVAR